MNKTHIKVGRCWIGVVLCGVGLTMPGCRTTSPGPPPTSEGVAAAWPAPAGQATLHPQVKIETTLGDFFLELDAEKAPISLLNFIDYVDSGFYDGTVFHRVVQDRLIQGGAYTASMNKKTEGLRPGVQTEAGSALENVQWTLAMFRRVGHPDSTQAEFFINVADNPDLDESRDGPGYLVIGRVIDGFATIEAIRNTPVGPHPNYAAGKSDVVPVEPVVIESIRLTTPFDRQAAEELADRRRQTIEERLEHLVAKLESEAGTKAVRTDSGLIYVDSRVGDGAFPTLDDHVVMYYRGNLLDGPEIANQLEEAATVEVSRLIKGMREGLQSMRERGKRTLIVPPSLGYGDQGYPRKIPPGATLVYEIELLEVRQ